MLLMVILLLQQTKILKIHLLEKIGKGGSHSPRARIPEILDINRLRGKKPQLYDLPKDVLRKAGIPTTSAEAFNLYLLDNDQGTGVHLTQKTNNVFIFKVKTQTQLLLTDIIMLKVKKQKAANKKYQQAVDIAEQYNVSKVVNGVNGNGVNGNGANGLIKNGKGIKNGKVAGALGATGAVLNNKAVKKLVRWVPVVGGGMVLLNAKVQAEEAIANPTWQNKAQAGIAGVDVALEGLELATGGIAGLITTPLQIGLMFADQMIHQTEDSFQRNGTDWDARRASRRGQR